MNLELLKEIAETPGIAGREERIRTIVTRELKELADDLYTDNIGNLIVLKKGTSRKKVMAAAHMDEIGFVVTHIDDKGFLRFHPLGGFDPKTLSNQRVIVHGKEPLVGVMGAKPIHLMEQEERGKNVKVKDFFVDLGMSAEAVKEVVSVGDPITRERELINMGDCVNGKSLDNRVSVYALIEVFRQLKDIPFDFYAVFTAQEEVGIRGAQSAALAINPHFGIAIDTTIAYDVPGASAHEYITRLGEGAAIKILDGSAISDHRMVQFMKDISHEFSIKWQPEILTAGGTDTAAIQRMHAGGAIAGAISFPTRHIHQVIETIHRDDIKAVIDLCVRCVQHLDRLDARIGEK